MIILFHTEHYYGFWPADFFVAQFVVLLFWDLPVIIVGGLIVIWYIYQVVAGMVRNIRINLTGGNRKQFGSYVKKTILNNVS